MLTRLIIFKAARKKLKCSNSLWFEGLWWENNLNFLSLCKKVFSGAILVDYISEFPSIVSFCEKCKIQDQTLIHKGLGRSQKDCLSLAWESYVRKFN
jgi:hypothetical protein